MNVLTSLPLINKVEFGYSFSGQMTPDQLNNEYFAKCISCNNTWSLAVHDGQVVKITVSGRSESSYICLVVYIYFILQTSYEDQNCSEFHKDH